MPAIRTAVLPRAERTRWRRLVFGGASNRSVGTRLALCALEALPAGHRQRNARSNYEQRVTRFSARNALLGLDLRGGFSSLGRVTSGIVSAGFTPIDSPLESYIRWSQRAAWQTRGAPSPARRASLQTDRCLISAKRLPLHRGCCLQSRPTANIKTVFGDIPFAKHIHVANGQIVSIEADRDLRIMLAGTTTRKARSLPGDHGRKQHAVRRDHDRTTG